MKSTSTLALVMMTASIASASDGGRNSVYVYTVDMRRAVLATPAGRKVKATINRQRKSEERKIRDREQRLVDERAGLTKAEYHKRFTAIQDDIRAAEGRLEAEQDRLLGPILDRLGELITASQSGGVVVVTLSEAAPLELDSRCDRTVPLIKAYLAEGGGKFDLGRRDSVCRVTGLLLVSVDKVVERLPDTRAALARLDSLKDKRQNEIEMQRRRLTELEARARSDRRFAEEVRERRRQLDETFTSYQEELRRAEARTRDALRGRVERALARAKARAKGALFVEYFGPRPSWSRACEVSDWVRAWTETRTTWSALARECAYIR